ncbi:hypothetical protein [uncultured Anaerococcus sp.]|uniref:hypothetical protein n=1 Tax=Anaerococcus sp. AH8042_DFU013_CI05 TaxID=3385202 RepID=UPI0025FD652E|nr:hypothetical protein [uncultured Anaerococcus sp.]
MNKNISYMDKTYKLGRISTIVCILIMFIIPSIICTAYNIWPSFDSVMGAAGPLLAMYIPVALAEQLSMIPITGNSAYINSIMGNVTNIKFPAYLTALSSVDQDPGTEEADVIGMIAVCVSGMTTMIIILIGLILLVPLNPILTSPVVKTATSYIMPALFGSMLVGILLNNSAGSFEAKNKYLIGVIDLLLVFIVNIFIMNLDKKQGFAMVIIMLLSVLLAYIFYKNGIIKLSPKEKNNL